MDRSILAGISGFLLVIFVNLFSPVYLDFIPSFVVAILVIYVFRLGTLREGLVAAFMTYIFSDAILGTTSWAISYFSNEQIPAFSVDVWTMISPIVSAVSIMIAAYIGARLAQKGSQSKNRRKFSNHSHHTYA